MPEQEMGLAASYGAQMGQQSGAPQAASGGQMPTVEEIAQLLLQGITPEELAGAGVPKELVQEAMVLARQMAGAAQAPAGAAVGMAGTPMDEQGLAAQSARGM